MTKYTIQIDCFEGPLDLLLHLIEREQIDIYDIPITRITEQYIHYLKTWEEFNVEIASEFIVMASTLLLIKSKMLLPKANVISDEEASEEDPRHELVTRLLEYRSFKQMAIVLQEMTLERGKQYSRDPMEIPTPFQLPTNVNLDELIRAIAYIWENAAADDLTVITREEVSVQDKMYDILSLLQQNQGRIEFSQTAIRFGTKSEIIISFLAMLELIRLRRVSIEQEKVFGVIFILLKE